MKAMVDTVSIAPKAMPTPIPVFALVERPLLPLPGADELVADGIEPVEPQTRLVPKCVHRRPMLQHPPPAVAGQEY
jgi:hypothetical protein